ncbi:hypothetical protein FA04_14600 [Ensifer adhaerens]|nr:hypothetical protein FA04_14600 [Ensifer adhaerens]KDP70297.1 hypothetical protein FA04_29110 [Ensifer adhaerens]
MNFLRIPLIYLAPFCDYGVKAQFDQQFAQDFICIAVGHLWIERPLQRFKLGDRVFFQLQG